ncbi:sugar phosphate isomerase/epimerase family protein [Litchfieldia salsa]|uniref:Sugar phosphate isomerase/epimerase n=1 Tax=Litchfieldia salsa TaxID=930152 RepID=A0A1H0W039_9BACI|nr:sugar phosphate isomerase/epimerase family protein [Litchfieldia salsa]SDP84129.1 Sugar phosphate isomerase/epimerase [Litchfieldia salsa]
MKFSVFSVMTPDTTPERLVGYLKETGYNGVEWRFKDIPEELRKEQHSFWGNNLCTILPEITNQEIDDLRLKAETNGIEVVSITPYLNAGDLASTEQVLQVAQKFGASTVRIGVPVYDRSQNYNDLFKKAVAYLKEVEQMCKQYKIKGLVETHHVTIAPSASLAHRLVSQFDPKHIGVLYDPGNMVHEGYENYRMGLELLGEYLAHVHVKNACWQKRQEHEDGTVDWSVEWALVEKGIVDWKQVLHDLKAVGYDGYVGMEDFSRVLSTKESLKHNIDTVKRLLAEIELG